MRTYGASSHGLAAIRDMLQTFIIRVSDEMRNAVDTAEFQCSRLPEYTKAFAELWVVGPNTLNVSLLTTLDRLSVRWTDCLACHLELDTNARSGVYVLISVFWCGQLPTGRQR
jgi:hypothetical protein